MQAQQDRNWRNIQGILDRHFPQLLERYAQTIFSTDDPYWAELRRDLESFRAECGLDLRIKL